MQEILRKVDGVIRTECGYTGGHVPNCTYQLIKKTETGHAEALLVEFNPRRISFAELLDTWFFRMHNPTTLNR